LNAGANASAFWFLGRFVQRNLNPPSRVIRSKPAVPQRFLKQRLMRASRLVGLALVPSGCRSRPIRWSWAVEAVRAACS